MFDSLLPEGERLMPSVVEAPVNPLSERSIRTGREVGTRNDVPDPLYDLSTIEAGEGEAEDSTTTGVGSEEESSNGLMLDAAPASGEPIPGYLQLSVPEILDSIRHLDAIGIGRVMAFEKAHRNRKTLLIK